VGGEIMKLDFRKLGFKRLDPPYQNYIVYNDGRVWSTYKHAFLVPTKANNEYLVLWLWANNKPKLWLVHRLVATVFILNPNGYKVVNHKDGSKYNNHWRNLEWCTQKYNLYHAQCHGKNS
jgi:hypothetical protein